MVEGELGKGERRCVRSLVVGVHDPVADRPGIGRIVEKRDQDGALERRQPSRDLRHLGADVESLAGIAVAIDRDEHLGCDLAKPVEHAGGAEIGRGEDQIAPSDAVASMATIVSGMFGR